MEERFDEMETLAEAIVEEEETMEKKDGFFTKVGRFTKKHGKKLLVGALIAGAGVIGYNKGKKSLSNFEEDFDFDSDDVNDVPSEDFVTNDEEN